MIVGVHNESTAALAKSVTTFPLSVVERPFVADPITAQDLITRFKATALRYVEAGQTVVWSFKPTPADVANGAWKPFVQAFARYLKDNGYTDRVIVVIWHEPENDVPKYFKSAADFVRLFNTVHDWLIEVDPSIRTSHAALGYYYRNVTIAQAKQWVTKCSIHSVDIYSGRSFPLSMTLRDSKPFKIWKDSRPIGAKWGVSERGFIATADKSAERVKTIDAESDYLASLAPADQPSFYIVWNTAGTEKDPTIVLDAAGEAAVNRMFARLTQLICPLCHGAGRVDPGVTYTVVRPS